MSLPDIPASPGAYYLHLILSVQLTIRVGQLGTYLLHPGHYVYCGSAMGPGGLRARLGRHLTGNGKLHWHIDYLRRETVVSGCGWQLGVPGNECAWNRDLLTLRCVGTPIPGFGACDCRRGCPAHLVYSPEDPNLENGVKWGDVTIWRTI